MSRREEESARKQGKEEEESRKKRGKLVTRRLAERGEGSSEGRGER